MSKKINKVELENGNFTGLYDEQDNIRVEIENICITPEQGVALHALISVFRASAKQILELKE